MYVNVATWKIVLQYNDCCLLCLCLCVGVGVHCVNVINLSNASSTKRQMLFIINNRNNKFCIEMEIYKYNTLVVVNDYFDCNCVDCVWMEIMLTT